MMRRRIQANLVTIKHVATILLWLAPMIDASPWWFDLTTEEFVLCVALAMTGSFAWIHRTQSRPATELFLVGKELGRREAMLEQECANVTRMAEHAPAQRLRVVD